MTDVHQVLREKFGFNHFRPGQEQVIRDVITGKDTVAILPTGMGKSLCYQLPAYMLEGTVLIVSPLIALMEDQVANMKRNGEKRVVALNSFLSYAEKKRVMDQLAHYKFIYISPEMLLQQYVMQRLRMLRMALLVVDEAHCISQWGFDFRPDYLRMGEVFMALGRPPVLALTATADEQVVVDISRYLHLHSPAIHRQSIDRPNISYAVVKLNAEREKTTFIIERVTATRGPGIIYVASRKRADQLAIILQEQGVSVAAYHAGKEQEDRAFIQEQFIAGEINWICATNAFGMGIHKNNIRQVIHEHIPKTISDYLQEVGRAGRDGELSAATLLFSPDDEGKTRFIVQEDIPQDWEIRHFARLLAEKVPAKEAAQMTSVSETAKRVIEYYMEQMTVEEVIQRMAELLGEKEVQLQKMLCLVQSACCIRESLLALFDERCDRKPVYCCSVCGTTEAAWLIEQGVMISGKRSMDWEARLVALLG